MTTIDIASQIDQRLAELGVASAGEFAAPQFIVPPASVGQPVAMNTWPGANRVISNRFVLHQRGTFRYVNFHIGESAGNIEVAVIRFGGTDNRTVLEKRMSTGIIPCPPAGAARLDLGETVLEPSSHYALAVWADNATWRTTCYASPSGDAATLPLASARLTYLVTNQQSGILTGVTHAYGAMGLTAITLEA